MRRKKQLVEDRVVDHPADHLSSDLVGYGGAEERVPVGVVRGAVYGVDDPSVPRVLEYVVLLLGNDVVVGEASGDQLDDPFLAGDVNLGHDVDLALIDDGVSLPEMLPLYPSGFKGQFYGKFKYLIHGDYMI